MKTKRQKLKEVRDRLRDQFDVQEAFINEDDLVEARIVNTLHNGQKFERVCIYNENGTKVDSFDL